MLYKDDEIAEAAMRLVPGDGIELLLRQKGVLVESLVYSDPSEAGRIAKVKWDEMLAQGWTE